MYQKSNMGTLVYYSKTGCDCQWPMFVTTMWTELSDSFFSPSYFSSSSTATVAASFASSDDSDYTLHYTVILSNLKAGLLYRNFAHASQYISVITIHNTYVVHISKYSIHPYVSHICVIRSKRDDELWKDISFSGFI